LKIRGLSLNSFCPHHVLSRVGRPHPPVDLRALFAFDQGNIVLALQIDPELRVVAKISAKPPTQNGAKQIDAEL
jgi:hypothetical protein